MSSRADLGTVCAGDPWGPSKTSPAIAPETAPATAASQPQPDTAMDAAGEAHQIAPAVSTVPNTTPAPQDQASAEASEPISKQGMEEPVAAEHASPTQLSEAAPSMLATATFGSQDARAAVAPPPNVSHAQQSAKPVIVPIIAPRTPVGGRGRALVVPLAPGQSVRDSSMLSRSAWSQLRAMWK